MLVLKTPKENQNFLMAGKRFASDILLYRPDTNDYLVNVACDV
jgi:hypothetical protein